jgi:hypothetical protein
MMCALARGMEVNRLSSNNINYYTPPFYMRLCLILHTNWKVMRQRIKKEVLSATSSSRPKATKRKRANNPATAQTQGDGLGRIARSKKALKKLLNNQIKYKPFTRLKETQGAEGNYWKLIYNTPKS